MPIGTASELFDDRYELMSHLGDGGYGEVWRARDRHRGHEVALKLLRAHDRRGAWREASLLTALRSPHILEVNNADVCVDVPYLDTALAKGSLDKVTAGLGMEPHRAVESIRRALRGLELCHTRGLLHRDVKPANLFLDLNDDVRLGDFGIAEVMDAQGTASQGGDPRVRAPEAYLGARFSVASDVYGCAVSLYTLLTGRWPFPQLLQTDLDAAIASGRYVKVRELAPHVSSALARVVSRGLALRPEDRYDSAAAFDSALGSLPVRSRRFTPVAVHPGHRQCWSVTGQGSNLSVCVADVGRDSSIDVRHEPSQRHVREHCSTASAATLTVRLRAVFDKLR